MVYVKNVYFKWFGGVYFFLNLDLNLLACSSVYYSCYYMYIVVYRLKGVSYKGT